MQRNIHQQPRPTFNTRWSSWALLIGALTAFIFVAVTVYQLGDAYLENQRLRREHDRLVEELERLRELYTTEDGETMFTLYIEGQDDVVVTIPILSE